MPSAAKAFTGLALLLGLVVPTMGLAQPQVSPSTHPAYLAETTSFDVTSQGNGRRYQISVALPYDYSAAHAPYPVVYALDANSEFGMVVETLRVLALSGRAPPAVIVGVGYDRPGQSFHASGGERAFDLTMPVPPRVLAEQKAFNKGRGYPEPPAMGGAPSFLRFLREELSPLIEARYNVSHADRTLWGHSFAGHFATYALLADDGFFQRFVIGSPSQADMAAAVAPVEAEALKRRKDLPARVYVGVGGEEEEADYGGVSDVLKFCARLQGRRFPSLALTCEAFPGESHTSVIPIIVTKGFSAVYVAPPAPKP